MAHPTCQSTNHVFSTYHEPNLLLSCPRIISGTVMSRGRGGGGGASTSLMLIR
jgi:hypothetical protein